MESNGDDRRKILRVVEADPERLTEIKQQLNEQDRQLDEHRQELTNLRTEAEHRTKIIEKVEKTTEKLDEAIRGNGKEGLNQQVAELKTKVGDMSGKLDNLLDQLKDSADFALRMNTGKFRTIAREEIRAELKEAAGAPGGWAEFRKSFLFPTIMIIVSVVIGGWLNKLFFP